MDCYDEILNIYYEKDRIGKCLKYLTELINKKSKFLTELQFKNCIILTLAIRNPNFIDHYFSEGKEISDINDNNKDLLNKLLKSEFKEIQ
ncbi:MAG: hypothetical protein ACW98D_02100 [Promethearchaeota archaeon]|jgi:hypothetical protein